MKKFYIIFVILVLLSTSLYAKKVKFSVDMTGQTINKTGVHIGGDFQEIAGFDGGDWQSNTTPMTVEEGTNIYSVTVDIPAFRKYEYKFLNGDQWYEVEFIQLESRVGYDFNDNRWIYIDSLNDEITNLQPVLFAGNAPKDYFLVRFLVDMNNEMAINANGVHISGDFQEWDAKSIRLYNFENDVYEIIYYLKQGTYQYKFVNGNETLQSETVPSECASSGNRTLEVNSDIVLNTVCFAKCTDCITSTVWDNIINQNIKIYPNPINDLINLELQNVSNYNIKILDLKGKMINEYSNFSGNNFSLPRENMLSGVYMLVIKDKQTGHQFNQKIVLN